MRTNVTLSVLALLAGAVLLAGQSAPPQNSLGREGDALVDIGGRRLHVSCAGTRSPTVILEAGMGESAATWKALQPAVAEFTRVCAYDRARRGTSDPDPSIAFRTARVVVDDLARLLRAAAITGPYVLPAHSFRDASILG